MTTRPLTIDGGELHVNVDAGNGTVAAEVVDAETMAPLPGLSFDDAQHLSGDHVNGRIGWTGDAGPSSDRPVRLRFSLDYASLYAFWMERA